LHVLARVCCSASNPTCVTAPADLPAEILVGSVVSLSCLVMYNGSAWQRPFLTWYNSGLLTHDLSEINFTRDADGHLTNVFIGSTVSVYAQPPTFDYTCGARFRTPCASDDQPTSLSQTVPQYASGCPTRFAMVLCE
jgi:hypothetical protein